MKSGLLVRHVRIGGSPFQGQDPTSEDNDGPIQKTQTTQDSGSW